MKNLISLQIFIALCCIIMAGCQNSRSITVIDEEGNPIEGARVSPYPISLIRSGGNQTNQEGRLNIYQLHGVTEYSVSASGYIPQKFSYPNESGLVVKLKVGEFPQSQDIRLVLSDGEYREQGNVLTISKIASSVEDTSKFASYSMEIVVANSTSENDDALQRLLSSLENIEKKGIVFVRRKEQERSYLMPLGLPNDE